MTQEEKNLLLRDLCARLPYGVKICARVDIDTIGIVEDIMLSKHLINIRLEGGTPVWIPINSITIKPYLRPMSSMTEDEKNEFDEISNGTMVNYDSYIGCLANFEDADAFYEILQGINWLNSHHFDYRNLIEKGLALEAPTGMYNIKD